MWAGFFIQLHINKKYRFKNDLVYFDIVRARNAIARARNGVVR
jgi:hypothetical protein